MSSEGQSHRLILENIAHRAMLTRGLLPDFSTADMQELENLKQSAKAEEIPDGLQDLRGLIWCSIDNDDSRDIDQLTAAEELTDSKVKVLVAIADVAGTIRDESHLDEHARHNTTSVYTAARIFPMLPEDVSTGLTSLNYNSDRVAIVIEMVIGLEGSVESSAIYRALVRNKAKLAYNSVAEWLENKAAAPEEITQVPGLAGNLLLQDRTAQRMKRFRHSHGALSFETIQSRPVFEGDKVQALKVEKKNRAKEIVEDFMIAANGVTARFLASHGSPSIRRVVRSPRRWDRIVALAATLHYGLPEQPDAKALEQFLVKARADDPLRFPDLSLSIIKLMGAGEYVAESARGSAPGHFGLAVKDYTHSTAPNRRYPDLLTQRLLKAALDQRPSPYRLNELELLAEHCTQAEDAANKVERQVGKSAAALLLEDRIGEHFEAFVTGAASKGTWVRLLNPAVEGKLVSGYAGLDVGDRLNVELIKTDVERGFIDFKRVGSGKKR